MKVGFHPFSSIILRRFLKLMDSPGFFGPGPKAAMAVYNRVIVPLMVISVGKQIIE